MTRADELMMANNKTGSAGTEIYSAVNRVEMRHSFYSRQIDVNCAFIWPIREVFFRVREREGDRERESGIGDDLFSRGWLRFATYH